MRKCLCPVLALLALLLTGRLLLPLSAAEILVSDVCGEDVSYTVYDDGSLILSGSGTVQDMTPSTIPWAEYTESITSVEIPDGITVLGIDVFLNLSVTAVTIPDSVILIGAHAVGYSYDDNNYLPVPDFVINAKAGTEAERYASENGFLFEPIAEPLPSGTFGNNLTWELNREGVLTIAGNGAIGDFVQSSAAPWADYITGKDDYLITSVVISPGITALGAHMFEDCRRITAVTLPSGLTRIGKAAFKGCYGLSSVTIPGSVSAIAEEAFSACTGLTSITIESGVTAIREEAFSLSGLSSVSLPATVTEIAARAFQNCQSLTSAEFPGGKTVGAMAFAGCSALKSVTFGSPLTVIGESAFESCGVLSSVSFPGNLSSIGNRAFYACSSLTSLTLPNSLQYLGQSAFTGCTSLSSVSIGNGLAVIEESVFENDENLTSVTLGTAVTTVEERAFANCPQLHSIQFPRSIRVIAPHAVGFRFLDNQAGGGTFEKYTGFTLTVLAYQPSVAKNFAQENGFIFQPLGTIDKDEGPITETANWSINTQTGVLMIQGTGRLPDYATFGDAPWALYRDYLRSVIVGNGIQNVSASGFENCGTVTTINIGGAVTEIGEYAFSGTSIESLVLPKSVRSIGDGAFEGCLVLRSVTLPEKIDSIGQFAFRNTNALTSIYLPESVSFIGANAIGYLAGNAPAYGFVIKGVRGSIAENYAEMNGITFREDGFILVTDESSGASVSIVGDNPDRYALRFYQTEEPLSPELMLAGNEYVLVYVLELTHNGEPTTPDGAASVSLPIPPHLNPIAVTVYAYNSGTGTFDEVDVQTENGYFLFSYHQLDRFIFTNVNLNNLYTLTVSYLYEDGAHAVSQKVYRASAGAAYNFAAPEIEGYTPDRPYLSGQVKNGNLSLVFTYSEDIAAPVTTEAPPVTEPPKPPKPTNTRKILLIVAEVVLVLALIAAVAALVILNIKKKREAEEKAAIAASRKRLTPDKFGDTIVVPEVPIKELDIQSLFADEPEADTDAIIEEMQRQAAGHDGKTPPPKNKA